MGLEARLRLSGRRRRRPRRRAGKSQGQNGIRPGPPRGNGGLHGLGTCEVHRPGRAFATPPPVPARSICSTACTTPRWITCRWSRSSDSRREPRSARAISRKSICQTLFQDVAEYVGNGERARAGAASDRPRRAHRAQQARRHLRHPAQRPAGTRLRGSAAGAWRDPYRRRLCRSGQVAGRSTASRGRRCSQHRQEGRHAGRRRRARCHR